MSGTQVFAWVRKNHASQRCDRIPWHFLRRGFSPLCRILTDVLHHTEELWKKREKNSTGRIAIIPVETVPHNCRFLSLVVSNVSWIQSVTWCQTPPYADATLEGHPSLKLLVNFGVWFLRWLFGGFFGPFSLEKTSRKKYAQRNPQNIIRDCQGNCLTKIRSGRFLVNDSLCFSNRASTDPKHREKNCNDHKSWRKHAKSQGGVL